MVFTEIRRHTKNPHTKIDCVAGPIIQIDLKRDGKRRKREEGKREKKRRKKEEDKPSSVLILPSWRASIFASSAAWTNTGWESSNSIGHGSEHMCIFSMVQ